MANSCLLRPFSSSAKERFWSRRLTVRIAACHAAGRSPALLGTVWGCGIRTDPFTPDAVSSSCGSQDWALCCSLHGGFESLPCDSGGIPVKAARKAPPASVRLISGRSKAAPKDPASWIPLARKSWIGERRHSPGAAAPECFILCLCLPYGEIAEWLGNCVTFSGEMAERSKAAVC